MHRVFALLVRHSEWLTNHLVRSDFQVEAEERVVKTSPYESHSGNPSPRATKLLNRIWVGGRREDDHKQPGFQQGWFLGVIGGGGEVIALHPDGTHRHHGERRESPLDEPEKDTRELLLALAQLRALDWRTPRCKTCENTQCHKGCKNLA